MMSDQEKLALISEAVQELKDGKLKPFVFSMVVGSIIDQQEVSAEDLAWGKKRLAALREAAQQKFAVDSACLCEQKPEDEQYLNVDPKCPVHNPPSH